MRRTRLKRSNPARRRKTHARNYGEPHPVTGLTRADAIRSMRCLDPDHSGCRSVAAHAMARGQGGCKGDARTLVPLCPVAHDEAGELPSLWYRSDPERFQETKRGRWQARTGVDLLAKAERLACQLDEEGYP